MVEQKLIFDYFFKRRFPLGDTFFQATLHSHGGGIVGPVVTEQEGKGKQPGCYDQ